MKTNVIVTPEGHVVPDNRALEFATSHSTHGHVSVGTGVMVDAFRLLKAQGKIEELTITFCNGEVLPVDKDGRVEGWRDDPTTNASIKILSGLLNILGTK